MNLSSPTTCSKHGSLQSLTTSFSILHSYTLIFPKYRETHILPALLLIQYQNSAENHRKAHLSLGSNLPFDFSF